MGIIGIAAAITLQALINNSRNKQFEVGLKRRYSLIAQALYVYKVEKGERIKAGEFHSQNFKNLILPTIF